MDLVNAVLSNIWIMRIFWSIIVILFCIVIYALISHLLKIKEKKKSLLFSNKKNQTFIKIMRNIVGYVLLLIAFLLILQIFGVDVTSMLAGVGIVGIIIGFAIQDALKDVIRGFDIVSDSYYSVGDVIKFGDVMGKVVSVSLKTTKVVDMITMNTVSISNRKIDQVEVVSNATYVTIPLPYELKVKKAEEIVKEIMHEVKKNPEVSEVNYLGVLELAESSVKYLVEIVTEATIKRAVNRRALKTTLEVLEKHKISVPYRQIDVHSKK